MARTSPKEKVWYSFLVGSLRHTWMRSPPRWLALKAAFTGVRGEYFCAKCKEPTRRKDVQVDHIEEIGRPATLDEFAKRLFCPISGLQVLCKPCHKEKTSEWMMKRAKAIQEAKRKPSSRQRSQSSSTRRSSSSKQVTKKKAMRV